VQLYSKLQYNQDHGQRQIVRPIPYNKRMLAIFSLRLALGMLGSLFLLSPSQMHPRFFRTHFLTALGLSLVAVPVEWHGPAHVRLMLLVPAALAFVGSLAWAFEQTKVGWAILILAVLALVLLLRFSPAWERLGPPEPPEERSEEPGRLYICFPHRSYLFPLIDHLSSAALLGFAMTAMLVGHSYLISPGLSIRPLILQLAAFFVALVLRAIVAGVALWFWTADHSLTNLNDEVVLWLPVRWLIGIVGPAVFGFLAYRTAKIRSTQSATGILYVVVILVFLGELNALLLQKITGLPL
jgi:hypothetical protein